MRQTDTGLFLQDDWRIRPRLTLTAGLRYEVQTNIGDRRNFAPRIGIAWAPGKGSGYAVRRCRSRWLRHVLRTRRSRPHVERAAAGRQSTSSSTWCPTRISTRSSRRFPGLAGACADQAVRRMDSNLHAPYIMQSAFTYERQLPRNTTLSVTYSNARGVRVLRSRNINAPAAGFGLRPFGRGNIYQYESSRILPAEPSISELEQPRQPEPQPTGILCLGQGVQR